MLDICATPPVVDEALDIIDDMKRPLDGEMLREAHIPATKDAVFCCIGDPLLILLASLRTLTTSTPNMIEYATLAKLFTSAFVSMKKGYDEFMLK